MSKWSEFYRSRNCTGYVRYVAKRYAPFIEEIKRIQWVLLERKDWGSKDMELLELGAGLGTITRLLYEDNDEISYRLLDNDPDMLEILQMNFKGWRNVSIVPVDILSESQKPVFSRAPDRHIIHSHGLLEHFSRDQIKTIIDCTGSFKCPMVHYVPTNGYDKPSFGDEMLISPEEWQELVRPDHMKTFNDGKDLMLIWYGDL